MNEFKFKTTINCGGCVARVTPILNADKSITNWKVDTDNPDKILTVLSEVNNPDAIINAIKKAGFKIEVI